MLLSLALVHDGVDYTCTHSLNTSKSLRSQQRGTLLFKQHDSLLSATSCSACLYAPSITQTLSQSRLAFVTPSALHCQCWQSHARLALPHCGIHSGPPEARPVFALLKIVTCTRSLKFWMGVPIAMATGSRRLLHAGTVEHCSVHQLAHSMPVYHYCYVPSVNLTRTPRPCIGPGVPGHSPWVVPHHRMQQATAMVHRHTTN